MPITSDSNQTSTVQGDLVQCKYAIKCEVRIQGFCIGYGQSPALEKHVVIRPSSIPVTEPPGLPEEWKALLRT